MCWIIVIVLIIVVLSFLVWASADIASNIYLRTICKGRTADRVVALTFDDGPDSEMTLRVLDILKQYGIKATFFLVGNKVKANPEVVYRMYREGHIVANHTYSHLNVFPLSNSHSVKQEIKKTDQAISSIIGRNPNLFRPPFGVTNPIIGKVVKQKRMTTIGWSIRSLDTISKRSRSKVCEKVIGSLHPGAIILLHDVCQNADMLLDLLIPMILEQGYRIIPLNELLSINSYENKD